MSNKFQATFFWGGGGWRGYLP